MKHISSDGNYTIDREFIDRVREVVDYAYELDMYIILNLHHESWVNRKDLDTEYMTVGKELQAVWTQLAEAFADYDQHLIFEAMNEPRMAGTDVEWSGNNNAYDGINYLNQLFAYTIRSSHKGYNDERCLMIPGYAASSSVEVLKSISLPTFEGKTVNNLIISVHAYTPYDFCLSDALVDFDQNDSKYTGGIDSLFQNLEELFLVNDIPVVIGETGATDSNNPEARANWAEYFGKKAYEYGIPILIWDNGAFGHSGGECHAWINRRNCEWVYPEVVDSLFKADEYINWGERALMDILAYKQLLTSNDITGGTVIWQNEDGLSVPVFEKDKASSVSVPMVRSYITGNKEFAIAYKGDSDVRLVFFAEDADTLSSEILPYTVNEKENYKIALFKYRTVNDTLIANSISNPSSVKEMQIFGTESTLDIYEVATVSTNATVTYTVNGREYNSISAFQNGIPELPGMKFLGWYTTKDFRKGTEFEGKAGKSITVYAKMALDSDEAAGTYSGPLVITEAPSSAPDKITQAPTLSPVNNDTDPTEVPSENDASQTPESDDNGTADSSDEAADNNSGPGTGLIILIAVLAAAVILTAVLLIRKKSSKKDDNSEV